MARIVPGNVPFELLGVGVVMNWGPGTVYYDDDPHVSASAFAGTLTAGQTTPINGAMWFVSDATGAEIGVINSPFDPRETGSFGVTPQQFGAQGDGATDDTAAIQAAIDAAAAAGGGVVRFPRGTYRITGSLRPKTNVRYLGEGRGSVITATTAVGAAFQNNSDLANATWEALTFIGGNAEPAQAIQRARTISPSVQQAILLRGDLVPNGESAYVVRDIEVRDCHVIGTETLPLQFRGVRGKTKVTGCHIYNCMDTGFVFCESAIFTNNYVEKGADNGVSASRGCQRAVITGNDIRDMAYSGIFCAGFEWTDGASAPGPLSFVITGNTITGCGKHGIQLSDAPCNGVVVGNTIRQVQRGPVDFPTDTFGNGIFVSGYPGSAAAGALTTWAERLLIASNVIEDCDRNGIWARGLRRSTIRGNVIVDPGEQFLVDGTTAILASDSTANSGVVMNETYAAEISDVEIIDNTVFDTRAAPFGNFAVVARSLTNSRAYRNRGIGLRNTASNANSYAQGIGSGTHLGQAEEGMSQSGVQIGGGGALAPGAFGPAIATTLSAAITATSTTIPLTSAAGLPATGMVIIGTEVVSYGAISTNSLTGCVRGYAGTTAAARAIGFAVTGGNVMWTANYNVAFSPTFPAGTTPNAMATVDTFRGAGLDVSGITNTGMVIRMWSPRSDLGAGHTLRWRAWV